jgi:ketosteroid isomerase-like protein
LTALRFMLFCWANTRRNYVGSQNAVDEAEIRRLIEEHAKALHDKNAAGSLAHLTQDAVIFDLAPPLRSAYANENKTQEWMNGWEGPIESEARELALRVSGDSAYWYGYSWLRGHSKAAGQDVDFWMRMTMILERVNGRWKMVHEHSSVPFYMDGSMRPAFDLKP